MKKYFADPSNPLRHAESQYVDRLIAELESQPLLIERLDPTGAIMNQNLRPADTPARGFPGRFMLIHNPEHQPAAALRQELSITEAAATYPRFLLVGTPGSGKSALLRWLILNTARAYRATQYVIPFPFRLNLAQWKTETTLEGFIRSRWPLGSDPIKSLAQGKVALYLEGLSEIEDSGGGKTLLLREWLNGPNAPQRVVIACRQAGDEIHFNLGLPVILAAELNAADIRRFVHEYLEEPEVEMFLSQVLPEDGSQGKRDFRYQMARNPFLLSAMLAVYRRSPAHGVPSDLGALLRQLVADLWASRQQATANDVAFEDVETALTHLAFDMVDANMPVYVPQAYAAQYLRSPAMMQAALDANLLALEETQIRFSYQLIQDYFASQGLHQVGLPTRLTRPQFNEKVERIPGKWDSAIRILASAAGNPEAVVLSIAEVDPYLALHCALTTAPVSDRTYPMITRQILETMQGDRRIALARLFMGIDDEKAMLILFEVMRDAAWPIRQFAATLFNEIELPLLPGLAQALEELEDRTRETTLTALRQLGKTALPTLVRLLKSDNWHLRRGAVWALGEMKDKAAMPLLAEALNDPDPQVSADAASAIGRIRDNETIPVLLDALGHANWRTGEAASKALAGIGKPAVPALLKVLDGKINSPMRQVNAIEALAAIDDPAAAAALLDASYMQNADVRGAAIEGLRNFRGEAVTKRLVECLSDTAKPRSGKQRICDIAADILDSTSGVEAVAALEQWRKGESESQSRNTAAPSGKKARERLKRVKEESPSLAGDLESALKNANWVVRRNAVIELTTVASATAIPRLAQALNDEDSQVRLAVVKALAAFQDAPGAISALIEALNDDEYMVCDAAKEALKQLGKPPMPALLDTLHSGNVNTRGAAIEVLGSVRDTSAIPAIVDCLSDLRRPWLSDERICDIAAKALDAIGTPESLEAVRQWRSLTQPSVQSETSSRLTDSPIPQNDVLSELFRNLRVKDWDTRQKAAKALSDYARTLRGVADKSATPRLVEELRDEDWVVRWATAEALGWFRDRSTVGALTRLVQDPKWKVRVAAIRALAEIGDPTAAETIVEALADSHSLVREAAAEALGNLGNPVATDGLVRALSDTERFVRMAAIDALGKFRDPDTINDLLTLLSDSDDAVRCFTVYALARIGHVQVVPALIACLEDTAVPYWEDRRICDIAAEALETIGTPAARGAVSEWKQQQANQDSDS